MPLCTAFPDKCASLPLMQAVYTIVSETVQYYGHTQRRETKIMLSAAFTTVLKVFNGT